MHAPKPYGRFVKGAELSADDASAVANLSKSLTNFKTVSELESLKWRRTLPSGRVAVAMQVGQLFKVMVLEGADAPDAPQQETEELNLPMLFCGTVRNAAQARLEFTQQTRKRLELVLDSPPAEASLQRFVVQAGPMHPEFGGTPQAEHLRPTWFSGRMATVVQIALGYGRQNLKSLPRDELEQAEYVLPPGVASAVRRELTGAVMPGYKGRPHTSGQIQYDFKFGRSDGVAFDTSGAPWLVRVSEEGVHAMPLPVIPETATAAFKAHVEEEGDTELQWVLDTFGAMPSGEGFPATESDFQAWRRAGVIQKVCEAADFYDHEPYSSAVGWSFALHGGEAVNTCFGYGADGIQNGYTYKLSLRLGVAENRGVAGLHREFSSQQVGAAVGEYVARINGALGAATHPGAAAIRYKLAAADEAALYARARGASSVGAEIDYWDNLERPPIATHQGGVRRISEGKIIWVRRAWYHDEPEVKFPVLAIPPYCQSHSLRALGAEPDEPPPCDTIIHAYFSGNEMKVVRYFYDPTPFPEFDVPQWQFGTWEASIFSGTYHWKEKASAKMIPSGLYSTDYDDREEAGSSVEIYNVNGYDEGWIYGAFSGGYNQPPDFGPFLCKFTSAVRLRVFYLDGTRRDIKNYEKYSSVCVPVYHPNSHLYAKSEVSQERLVGVAYTKSHWDPWRSNIIPMRDEENVSIPCSIDHVDPFFDTQWAPSQGFLPFVEGPSWVRAIDNGEAAANGSRFWSLMARGNSSSTPIGPIEEKKERTLAYNIDGYRLAAEQARDGFFMASPSAGVQFYTDAISNVAGTADYTSIYESDSGIPGLRIRWGSTVLAAPTEAQQFFGVINE